MRRLFTQPGGGQLVAMDARGRLFPAAMARCPELRDQPGEAPRPASPQRVGLAWVDLELAA